MPINFILILLLLFTSYVQAYRFKGNKFFYYFFIVSFWSALSVTIEKKINLDPYLYFSISSITLLWSLPVRLYRYKIILSISAIMLSIRIVENFWLTALVIELIIIFSIYVILLFIYNEAVKENRISLFLIIVIFDLLLSGINVFIYFLDIKTFVEWFIASASLSIILYILNSIFSWKKKLTLPNYINNLLLIHSINNTNTKTTTENSFDDKVLDKLTKRENEILELVKQNYTNKEIAEKEHVEVTTIESHLKNIKEKLGFKKMLELRRYMKNLS